MTCDMTYIWEKYDKLIGFLPVPIKNEYCDWWQIVVLEDFEAMSLKALWMKKWNPKVNQLNANRERVLNFLCIINTMPLTLGNMLNTFREYIGPIESINKYEYSHIHELVKKFIEEYKTKFRRELNLEILE